MRAVLDPNVLISALISPRGTPARAPGAWRGGRFELIVSALLLEELEGVLLRTKFRRYVSDAEARAFVGELRRSATAVSDPGAARRVSSDPGDDYLVALARASGAEVIVSGDRHLLGLRDPEPPVRSPREFLEDLLRA